jgi:hypothetical protein
LLGSLLLRLLALSLLGPLLLRLLMLCGGRRGLPLRTLLLLLILLVMLRERGDNGPKKQKQGSRTGSSNESHTQVSFGIPNGYARRQPVRSIRSDAAITAWSARQVQNLPFGNAHLAECV